MANKAVRSSPAPVQKKSGGERELALSSLFSKPHSHIFFNQGQSPALYLILNKTDEESCLSPIINHFFVLLKNS